MRFRWLFVSVTAFDALLDIGKWAIGRYLSCNVLISCASVIIGSLVLSLIIQRILRDKGAQMRKRKVFKMDSNLGAAVSILGDDAPAEEVKEVANKMKEVEENGSNREDRQSQTEESKDV